MSSRTSILPIPLLGLLERPGSSSFRSLMVSRWLPQLQPSHPFTAALSGRGKDLTPKCPRRLAAISWSRHITHSCPLPRAWNPDQHRAPMVAWRWATGISLQRTCCNEGSSLTASGCYNFCSTAVFSQGCSQTVAACGGGPRAGQFLLRLSQRGTAFRGSSLRPSFLPPLPARCQTSTVAWRLSQPPAPPPSFTGGSLPPNPPHGWHWLGMCFPEDPHGHTSPWVQEWTSTPTHGVAYPQTKPGEGPRGRAVGEIACRVCAVSEEPECPSCSPWTARGTRRAINPCGLRLGNTIC